MRAFCVLLAVLILGVGVQAQDDDYRLRVPTISEYIAGIPDFEQTDQELLFSNRIADAVEAAELEFLHRYEDSADFSELNNAFNKLKTPMFFAPTLDPMPVINYNQWIVRIIQAWLNENSTDLDTTSEFIFLDYSVNVSQRDFNNDGQHEWVLNVTKDADRAEYRNYVVVVSENNVYRTLEVPVPWRADGYSMESEPGGWFEELSFGDINGDNLSEWLFQLTTEYVGPGYSLIYRYVYVVGWRGNQLVSLAIVDDPVFRDLDGDGIDELVATDEKVDNWGCGIRAMTVIRWNGTRYEWQPYQEQLNCLARYAEEAMWNGDFATAVEFYNEFIQQHQAEFDLYITCAAFCGPGRDVVIFKYFQARRIIAYTLLGQSEHAQTLLNALKNMPEISDFSRALLDVNTINAETLCMAAYNYFAEDFHPELENYSEESIYGFLPGRIIEDISGQDLYYAGTHIDPNRAGCDIRLLGDEPTPIPTLTPTPYPTYPPPTPDTRPQNERWLSMQYVEAAYQTGDYELTLTIASQAVPRDEFDRLKWGYYRALALEALNRPDEALAEYIEIFQAAPESVWGQLAALHLEKI